MFCSKCGSALATGVTFCPSCGTLVSASATVAAVPRPPLKRPTVVTVLAVLHIAGAALIAAGLAIFTLVGISGGQMAIGAPEMLVILLMTGFGAAQLVCGLGLLRLKPYARTLEIVLAAIGLLGIPIGTIISILILIYFTRPGTKILFSGRPVEQLTVDEIAQVNAAQGSGMVVLMVAVGCFVAIAAVGILAAIAIPGLLRARMSGNEASAIGSLRAIMSAQVTFASTCGDGYYAPDLKTLGVAPAGGEPFITSELGHDPSTRSGYVFAITEVVRSEEAPPACNGSPGVKAFFVSATPLEPGVSGQRFFGTNSTGTIFQSSAPVAATFSGTPENATVLD